MRFDTMEQIEFEKTVAELRKLNEETRKLVTEARLNDKRARWFEFGILLAVIAATVAVTKLFLS